MQKFKTLDDVDLAGKTCLVRVDLNLPMSDGKVTDLTRIERLLPTLKELVSKNAKIILISHFGRPNGQHVDAYSLKQIVPALTKSAGQPIAFCDTSHGPEVKKTIDHLIPGEILLLENTRFNKGEECDDPALAAAFAELAEVYINDAFSASHRAHASTHGVAKLLPSYAGRALEAELVALEKGLGQPSHPLMAIIGGAKISTKLDLINNLMLKVDHLVIGGGMANTFLAAQGYDLGKSLCEHDLVPIAVKIMAEADQKNCNIVLPTDLVVAKAFKAHAISRTCKPDEIAGDEMALDIGPQTSAHICDVIKTCKTLVWNGPLGAFEIEPFDAATNKVAVFAAQQTQANKLISVAGGGDTVSALNHATVANQFSYVSTAGGAFLEWMEGKELPGISALKTH